MGEVGSNRTEDEPLKPDDSDPICDGVQRRTLGHWREFLPLIDARHSNSSAYIYRGQSHDWPLLSTIDRLEARYPAKRNFVSDNPSQFECPPASREQHFRAFKEAARGRVSEAILRANDDEWWALARHHGLATPILDWTIFPFMALYFAFEDEHVRLRNEFVSPSTRYVYRVSWHLVDLDSEDMDRIPRTFVPAQSGSSRIVAQGGTCMFMPCGMALDTFVRKQYAGETTGVDSHPRAVLEIIAIPSTDRADCLKLLNKMGINRMAMYPDLDGSAAFINALWELDFDSPLGSIAPRHHKAT